MPTWELVRKEHHVGTSGLWLGSICCITAIATKGSKRPPPSRNPNIGNICMPQKCVCKELAVHGCWSLLMGLFPVALCTTAAKGTQAEISAVSNMSTWR